MTWRNYYTNAHPDIGGDQDSDTDFSHKVLFVFRKNSDDWGNHFNVQQANDASGTFHYVTEQLQYFLKGTIGRWDHRMMDLRCFDREDEESTVVLVEEPEQYFIQNTTLDLSQYIIEIISESNPRDLAELLPNRTVYEIPADSDLQTLTGLLACAIRGLGYSYITDVDFVPGSTLINRMNASAAEEEEQERQEQQAAHGTLIIGQADIEEGLQPNRNADIYNLGGVTQIPINGNVTYDDLGRVTLSVANQNPYSHRAEPTDEIPDSILIQESEEADDSE